MAKRDVELVIRAKDQARKAVDGITSALETLATAQERVRTGADKTGTSLAGLKNASTELQAKLQGLSALKTVVSEFDRASAAVNRLEAELKQSSTDLAKYRAESETAAANTARLTLAAKDAAAAVSAEQAAVAASRAALTSVNKELRTAEAAHRKLGGVIKQATQPNEQLRSEYIRQIAALTQLRTTQASAQAALTNHRNRLAELRAGVSQTNAALKTAETAEKRFSAEAEKAAAAVKRQEAALVGARDDLGQISGLATKASQSLGVVAATEQKVAESSRAAAVELEKVSAALERNQAASGAQVAAGPAAAATANYRAQRKELDSLSQSYREFQARATALGQQLRSTQNPSAELRAEFARMRDAARLAKEQFIAQGQALSQLRGTAGSSFSAFNARVRELSAETNIARGAQQGFLATLRQVAQQFFATGTAANQTATGMARATAGANGLRGAFAGVYGEGRKSLSLLQRFRGEIISLGVAYLGLFGIIRQFGSVIEVIRTLEATQNRLSAAFGQNQAIVASEMRFLRRESIRLGISFQVLANSYSQFAVSARLSGFSLEGIRDVFLSVAEAARVNKLSTEDMDGVFQALIQIIQKGKVQAEELRRQLGNRLPGAFQIMANAITGGDTALLEFQLRTGQLVGNEETLTKFAGALTDAFGAQLPAALQTVISEMGRFETNLFFAKEQVANAFVGPFTNALQKLSDFFSSDEGVRFFQGLGGAAAKVTDALVFLIEHMKLLIAAGTVFIGLKLLPSFTALAANVRKGALAFRGATAAMNGTAAAGEVLIGSQRVIQAAGTSAVASITRLQASLLSIAPAAGVARTGLLAMTSGLGVVARSVTVLTGLFRGLWAAIGGLPGLILTGVTFALTGWLTKVDDTNTAIAEHERILGNIIDQYSDLQNATGDWADAIEGVTLRELQTNLEDLQTRLQRMRNEAAGLARDVDFQGFGLFAPQEAKDGLALIRDIVEQQRLGRTTAEEFRQAISDVAESTNSDAVKALADRILDATKNMGELELATRRQTLIVASQTRALTEDEKAFLGLAEAMDTLAQEAESADERAARLEATVTGLKELIPQFDAELRRMQGLQDLRDVLDENNITMRDWIANWRTLLPLVQQAIHEINRVQAADFGFSGDSLDKAFELISRLEGFQSNATFDVNAFRAGFGSDTITLSDGSIHAITEGMSVSIEDAQRDLFRRIEEFQTVIIGQIGEQRFNVFSPAQQAALTSIAYNYGRLPDRILDAVRTGSGEQIAEAIRGLSGDNGGINANRRAQEAQPFLVQNRDLILANQELAAQEEEIRQSTRDRLADNEFAISQQELINAGKEREAAIEDAIRQAREENANITQEEIDQIAQQAGELFDLQNAEKQREERKAAAMERVNSLLNIQKELEQSIQTLRDRGGAANIAEAERLEGQLSGVKDELLAAVDAAIELATALGDDEMVANLRNIQLAAQEAADTMTYLGLTTEQVGQLGVSFVNGFVNFIDKASESIAGAIKGTNTWKEALQSVRDSFLQFASDFLREIALMIIKQAILNALTAAFGGGSGLGAAFVSAFHTGGIAGQRKSMRPMNPGWFAGAIRMHSGGLPGLRPSEVPIIAQKGEEILSTTDPRNILNGGGKGGGIKIVNALDASDMLNQALNSEPGQKVLLNHIRTNSRKFKQAIGG